MITINDNDLPITAAEKIIKGTKIYKPTELEKSFIKGITGEEKAEIDMFSVDEIKEIADYLMVYYNSHLEGD